MAHHECESAQALGEFPMVRRPRHICLDPHDYRLRSASCHTAVASDLVLGLRAPVCVGSTRADGRPLAVDLRDCRVVDSQLPELVRHLGVHSRTCFGMFPDWGFSRDVCDTAPHHVLVRVCVLVGCLLSREPEGF